MSSPPAPHILPMEEADLEEATRIEIWGNPENDMQKVLMGRVRTPEALAELVERRREAFLDPKTTFIKVVDPTTGGLMAWATWYFYPAMTEEEMARELEVPEGPSPQWPLPQWYRLYLEYRLKVLKGRPYYWLGMIVTAPEYRRRGAASLLLQWGIDKAEEAGVEIYLESSVAGRPLYEKFGFRVLKAIDFDMAQLGFEGIDTHICMLKPVRRQEI